jgi:hypothetical protein
MANIQIPNLPVAVSLNGTELFEAVQSGQSVRLSAQQLADFVESDVFGNVITVQQGGTGSMSLTGYVFGAGVVPLEGRPTIPNTDITGLGTASTVNLAVGPTAPSSPSVGDLWVDTN